MRHWCLCLLLLTTLPATEHVVIIVKGDQTRSVTAGPSAGISPLPQRRDDIYQAMWQHPDQVFIDSEVGPVPLYTDVVFDQFGNPRPRFPDALTKWLMDDPSSERALLYLAQRKARTRRYLEGSSALRRTAADYGFVTPEVFAPPTRGNPYAGATRPSPHHTPESRGSPILDPEKARELGLKPEEIPTIPGLATTRYVEVLFFWDWRCPHSMRGWRDWAQLAQEIFTRELGPRMQSISLDNDSDQVDAQFAFLRYHEVETKFSENRIDETDLADAFAITGTPTYILVDRRRGSVVRLEGRQSADALRQALLQVVGKVEQEWAAVEPAWFRPVDPAIGAWTPPAEPSPTITQPAFTPRQATSRKVQAWNPVGQSD